MLKLLLSLWLLLVFTIVYSQESGGESGSGGESSDNDNGGESGSGGENDNGGSSSGQRCGQAVDVEDCLVDGGNGTCILTVNEDGDCGECSSTQQLTCMEYLLSIDGVAGTYVCEDEDTDVTDLCVEPTAEPSPRPTAVPVETSTCTDYDDCPDEVYANWEGEIYATTALYNFRWLCYGCDWTGSFDRIFPDAVISITLQANCSNVNTDDDTSDNGDSDDSGDEGGSSGESGSGGSGGESDNDDSGDSGSESGSEGSGNDDGSSEGGSGGSESGSESGSNDGSSGGGSDNQMRRLMRKLLQSSGGEGSSGGESGSGGNSGGNDDSIYEGDGSTVAITITVDAEFTSCRAFSQISDKFTNLAQYIEDEIEEIDVTVRCSDLDCCQDDDTCTSSSYCDTDGDGVVDTNDGSEVTGDSDNGDSNSDSGPLSAAYGVNVSMISLLFVAFMATLLY